MGLSPQAGGQDDGPRPTELLLMAVGGCTSVDMVSTLGKMRVPFVDLEVTVSGQQAQEHPRYFTDIEVLYRIWGDDIPQDKVERAAQLSLDRYCSVSQTLEGRVRITHRVEVLPAVT